MKLTQVKPEIRVMGIDDGRYDPEEDEATLVVGVVTRGGKWIDGVEATTVTVDGTDATDRIAEMINASRHKPQLRVVMTDGITFAGFNLLDIVELHERTGLPVIAVVDRKPDVESVLEALENLDGTEERRKIVERAGPVHEVVTKEGEKPVYFQCAGIDPAVAEVVVKKTAVRYRIPEPIRVAHFVASATSQAAKELANRG